MSRCEHCKEAEDAPRRDWFTAGCLSCAGRALAAVGVADDDFDNMNRAYLETLERLFPGNEAEGHRHVKHWRARLKAEKLRLEAKEASTT